MLTTRVFKNGNSQAVRIPSELAYDRTDIEFEIERTGDEIRIRPARPSLDGVMQIFSGFPADFLNNGRNESEAGEREEF